jgi:hypothetical protein
LSLRLWFRLRGSLGGESTLDVIVTVCRRRGKRVSSSCARRLDAVRYDKSSCGFPQFLLWLLQFGILAYFLDEWLLLSQPKLTFRGSRVAFGTDRSSLNAASLRCAHFRRRLLGLCSGVAVVAIPGSFHWAGKCRFVTTQLHVVVRWIMPFRSLRIPEYAGANDCPYSQSSPPPPPTHHTPRDIHNRYSRVTLHICQAVGDVNWEAIVSFYLYIIGAELCVSRWTESRWTELSGIVHTVSLTALNFPVQ